MKNLKDSAVFEKKKWISITGLCNNNCQFCLDGGRPDKHHKSDEEIKQIILAGRDEGCSKLILSGGDPTIHPNVIEFVRFGRETGYSKIQIITNGRMFASKKFTDQIIDAGLDEVTFSIHGYNSKIHDSLTQVPGSFKQVLLGVQNVTTNPKIIINTDTCITNTNYRSLPETIRFIIEKIGIMEVNLMSMVPQGNAWSNKEEILYDFGKVAPYVHKVIDFCRKKQAVLWLSRFPPEYLEGYEDYIEDSYKMVDDIRGMGDNIFKDKKVPECKGSKCKYCGIRLICARMVKANQKFITNKLEYSKETDITYITKQNYKNLPVKETKAIFALTVPKRISEFKKIVPKISEVIPHLKKAIDKVKEYEIRNIPFCFIQDKNIRSTCIEPDIKDFVNKSGLDYVKLATEITKDVKVKSLRCKSCKYDNRCEGIYKKYVRIFGFEELKPII